MFLELTQQIGKLITGANLNRCGMILEFLSFWFAAPEIIGEQRLRNLRDRLKLGVGAFPTIISKAVLVTIVVAPWAVFIFFFIRRGWHSALIKLFEGYWFLPPLIDLLGDFVFILILLLALSLEALIFVLVEAYVAEPLLMRLADDARMRKLSLAIGALLFVLGFVLQFSATFIKDN